MADVRQTDADINRVARIERLALIIDCQFFAKRQFWRINFETECIFGCSTIFGDGNFEWNARLVGNAVLKFNGANVFESVALVAS